MTYYDRILNMLDYKGDLMERKEKSNSSNLLEPELFYPVNNVKKSKGYRIKPEERDLRRRFVGHDGSLSSSL